VGCPIARAENGLALSSRNARLSLEEQGHAAKIFAILKEVKQKFGTKNANELKEWVNHQFDNDAVLSLEYFEISDEITLKPMHNKQPNTVYRAFIAVHIRDVRLIDNIALN
jgi:pantoate--beta-alanine ligase